MNYSSNGKLICTAGEDSYIHIWDAETGAHLKSFGGDNQCVCIL